MGKTPSYEDFSVEAPDNKELLAKSCGSSNLAVPFIYLILPGATKGCTDIWFGSTSVSE